MVIVDAVFYEMALIDTGRHHGHVGNIQGRHCFGMGGIGLLESDLKGAAVRTAAYAQDVAPQVDDGAVYALFLQVSLHLVCNEAFCNGAKVNGCLII